MNLMNLMDQINLKEKLETINVKIIFDKAKWKNEKQTPIFSQISFKKDYPQK